MHRRRFLQCLAAASMTPVATGCSRAANTGGSASLVPDPDQILDLPAGFSYRIVSMAGTRMSDGLVVPGRHDGMAAFDDGDGRIRLVCNHECNPAQVDISAFPQGPGDLSEEMLARFYDRGQDRTPGVGGTTTTIYNPASGETERQFMSLAGTEINCAGGPTPWGSWLSCEECFTEPGSNTVGATRVFRDQHHGYIFEVPASSDGLVEPAPLKAMGRFEHEACAVVGDAIYMTEDRFHSLFYRFLPTETGNLAAGGRLQALAVKDRPSLQTHNWSNAAGISIGSELETHWIDIRDPDPSRNDVRLLGAAQGAATLCCR